MATQKKVISDRIWRRRWSTRWFKSVTIAYGIFIGSLGLIMDVLIYQMRSLLSDAITGCIAIPACVGSPGGPTIFADPANFDAVGRRTSTRRWCNDREASFLELTSKGEHFLSYLTTIEQELSEIFPSWNGTRPTRLTSFEDQVTNGFDTRGRHVKE